MREVADDQWSPLRGCNGFLQKKKPPLEMSGGVLLHINDGGVFVADGVFNGFGNVVVEINLGYHFEVTEGATLVVFHLRVGVAIHHNVDTLCAEAEVKELVGTLVKDVVAYGEVFEEQIGGAAGGTVVGLNMST